MTSSAPPSGAARAAGIILRVILNRISYQMLSLRGNRIKFYNKINKVLVYYNIQLCWNVGHPTLSNDTCTNACQFEIFIIFINNNNKYDDERLKKNFSLSKTRERHSEISINCE